MIALKCEICVNRGSRLSARARHIRRSSPVWKHSFEKRVPQNVLMEQGSDGVQANKLVAGHSTELMQLLYGLRKGAIFVNKRGERETEERDTLAFGTQKEFPC